MMWRFSRKKDDADEREKLARLEKAERDLTHLQARATTAHRVIDERRQRNHWRESIESMITGGI